MPSEPEPLPSAVAPTAEPERIDALDAVRGLAVLGILVMNVVEFALPMRAYDNPAYAGGTAGVDRWTWFAQVTLFDGRMRALFSMLFGAGIVLFAQRVERRGGSAADLLLRRCLWLVPFGIAHRFALQWTGDILYAYGLLGMIAIAFRGLRPRALLVIGLALLACFVPKALLEHRDTAALRTRAAEARAIVERGETVPEDLQRAQRDWERRGSIVPPKPDATKAEIDAMRGSWLDSAAHRWNHNHQFQSGFLYSYFVFDVLGMFLVGMALMKLGFFAGACRRATYLLAIAGGVAAAWASCSLARAWESESYSYAAIDVRLWRDLGYPFLRLLGALGWAAVIVLAVRAGVLRFVTAALSAVGRMAFSNYVLQTVLCTSLFLGWGFGLFGELSRAQTMLVWAGATVVQVVWSLLWLRAFRHGPLEWCWRALTYGERPSFRRRTTLPTTSPQIPS